MSGRLFKRESIVAQEDEWMALQKIVGSGSGGQLYNREEKKEGEWTILQNRINIGS